MPEFLYDPPLPTKPSAETFLQTIRLMEADQTIGVARWHSGDGEDGVVQLITLAVSQSYARRGFGRQLFDAVIAQASAYHRAKKSKLRRIWLVAEQKRQVIGRSFLTARGFHHVATIKELLVDQDALVYMKSFD